MQSRGGVGGVGSGLKKEKRERERERERGSGIFFHCFVSPWRRCPTRLDMGTAGTHVDTDARKVYHGLNISNGAKAF